MPDQVAEFLSIAEPLVNGPDAPPPEQDMPKVPFQTGLRLTAEQEKRMVEHAFKRKSELESESGRDNTLSPQWWMNNSQSANTVMASQGLQTADTFMGKRSRYDAMFLNDVSWRPWTMGPDNIFQSSNLAVPLARRIARQMIAKAKNMFFGAEPWFSISPAPVPEFDQTPDKERIIRIERFCRFKLKEAHSQTSAGRAIANAMILGECPVKTTYVVRDQVFNVEARVLHGTDGQPVAAGDGNYITEQDAFIDAEDGTGRRVLARDGITEEPLAPIWQSVPLNRRQVLFEGARSEPIFFKDFLCPLTATDVQSADTVIHLYDKPVMEFVDLIVKRGIVADDTDNRMAAAQRMVAVVKSLASNNSQPKSAANQQLRPNDQFASAPSVETGGPVAEFAEFYMWYDANGDGIAENIILICDKNTRAPIFYDHVANVGVDGLRPIEVVRVNPVEHRWYGLGVMELFDSYQNITDLLVNRWNFSQSRSGRVDFWTPTNTLEGDRDPNLKMNWGGTYTKKPGMKKEDCLETVYLTDVKFEQIHEMIQFFMQLAMNESGVTNANDDQAAGMQSAKLATGIMDVQQSGDELFKPMILDLKDPLTALIEREIETTLSNINPVEAYTYLEGDTMGIDRITKEEVQGLRFKANIELTTMKTQERIQIATQVIALMKEFYSQDPMMQARTAPKYRALLRSIDPTDNADTTIVPMPIMQAPAPGGGQPGGGIEGAPNTPFAAQLGQKDTQMKGVSAPGGTPKQA